MKKIIICIMLTFFLVLPHLVYAAGSCVQQYASAVYENSIALIYLCTGDASAGTVPNTDLPDLTLIRPLYGQGAPVEISHAYLYAVETVPGTGGAEPTAYTLTVQNSRGTTIADLGTRSATVKLETIITTGYPMADTVLTMVVGDLGNSDTTTIIFKFIR